MSDDVHARLKKTLLEFQLTAAEYAILHLIHYEGRHVKDAPGYARGLLLNTFVPPPTVLECRLAIESLSRRGLTTIIDRRTQADIIRFVRQLNCHGPTCGIPSIGQLDYTLAGADVWRNVLNYERPECARDYYWHNCVSFIYRTNATVVMSYDQKWVFTEPRKCGFVPVSDPEPIGPWRSQWWREIPHGFRLRCLPDRN